MSKYSKNVERQLIEIVNSRANENKCGDCGSGYPTWASYSLGVFLCGRCASVHRRVLPSNISKVKSLTLDNWKPDQIERLRRIGNKKAKAKWNSKKEPFPYDEDDTTAIEQYIKAKYIDGAFRDGSVDDYDDYGAGMSDDDRFSGKSSGSRARSRAESRSSRTRSDSTRSVPRLTHRKLTTFESSQFNRQASQIMGMGFNDADLVKEALILSNGDIDVALEILDQDAKVNPNQEETAPSLPRRPPASATSVTSSFSSSNPMASLASQQTSAGVSAGDWWSANGTAAPGLAATATGAVGQPQIYQYTDPITGRVSYVDSNGQEYLDPSNPEHQQLLYQQQNPQLVAQQTNKQQILSLYQQPDRFTSNVAVPVDPNQPQQPSQGQPLQTGQQPQMQQPFQTGQQPQMQQPFQTGQQPFQTGQQFQQFQQPVQQPTAMAFQQQPLAQQPTAMGFQQPYGQQQQSYWQ